MILIFWNQYMYLQMCWVINVEHAWTISMLIVAPFVDRIPFGDVDNSITLVMLMKMKT